jgi:hypothetical protein
MKTAIEWATPAIRMMTVMASVISVLWIWRAYRLIYVPILNPSRSTLTDALRRKLTRILMARATPASFPPFVVDQMLARTLRHP